ncbi:hypothetical protein BTZ20_2922 [Rhodococcus sp. MTM3W5.2]|nr:hypothetical protein BTZ20_2922 [Rhodococcus sp. MTM3W5.2]
MEQMAPRVGAFMAKVTSVVVSCGQKVMVYPGWEAWFWV